VKSKDFAKLSLRFRRGIESLARSHSALASVGMTDKCSFELAAYSHLHDHIRVLTERQRSVLDFIQREQREKGVTPSTREIQNHFGFASQTSVMQYIAALERKGFLNRHARKARALITPAMKVRITDIPIYGQIPAGMSALTEQSIEGHVSLDRRSANVVKNRSTFALRVRGDSMIGAHIVDGDIVILENTKEVHDGDIVAALIDGETSLKRYVVERGRPYLKAENPRYPDLVPARELKIQGVMVSLIRKQARRTRH
jgi:repressor LexA